MLIDSTNVFVNDDSLGGVIAESLSDSFSFSDAIVVDLEPKFNETLSDSFTFSDAINFLLNINVNLSDQFSFSDSISVTLNALSAITLSLSDSLNLTDQDSPGALPGLFIGYGNVLTDLVTLSDLVTLASKGSISISDTLNLSDSFGFTVPLFLNINPLDILNLSDSFKLNLNSGITLSDSFLFSDSINAQPTVPSEGLSDSFSFSDSVSVQLNNIPINISLLDTLALVSGGVNAVLLSAQEFANFSDTLVLSDSITIELKESFNSYLRRYLNDVEN